MKALVVAIALVVASSVWADDIYAPDGETAQQKENRAAAINAREEDYAECRVAAYQAQASNIEDYVVSCMRVAGYRLEGKREMGNSAFKAYCAGRYQPGVTTGRCDDQNGQ